MVTAIHFAAAAVIWFLLFGVALGLGFNQDWSTFDHMYSAVIRGLAYVLCFPALFLAEAKDNGLIIVVVQLVSSFVQANIVLALWRLITARNKAKQEGTP